MAVNDWSIIRQPNDPAAETRVSIGSLPNELGIYLVFRGEPENVINVLEKTLEKAREELPQGNYKDQRGRPQG